MKIKARVIQKVISVFSTFLLLINSFTPYLLIAPTFSRVKAQAETITPTMTVEPTLVPTETATPTPTVEATPTLVSTDTPSSVNTQTPTPTQIPSKWTFEKVEINKEYISPQNKEVKITFTRLPDPAGNINIEEIILTEDQIKQTGSLSNKAYDITSDMKDGDFSYNLSLPIPEASKGKSVEVKFAEELSGIGSAEKVENTLTKTDTSVSVASLDHMTIFVVVNPTPSGDLCVSAGATNGAGCYSTIQAAIGAANNGDEITVKNGTYILPSTLQVNKEVIIIGESQVGTIINATGVGAGYGIGISASNVTLKNFTINPNGASGGGYPIHVSNTPNLVSSLTLENITIDGSYRTAFDIHGVTGGSLKNLTVKNSSHGNGLSLTGSDTITVEGYTSSGNAWGGIALYNSKYTSPQRATHDITLKGNAFSISESIEIYEENEYGLTISGITTEGYDFKVTNDTYRGPGSENFVHYKKNITDASSYALELQTNPSVIANTASIIKQISTGDYYVVNGLKIQEAIAAANSGDTINVTAGTYVEAGQIVINKNLSIIGADKTTTIIKPAQDTGSADDSRGWFLVNSGKDFTLKNVTLDGTGHKIFQAIRSHGPLTIENNVIKNMLYDPSTSYEGRGVVAYDGFSSNILNNTLENIGRIGIFIYGTGTQALVNGNTYVGKGTGTWLDYGVEVGGGGQATVENNNISNNKGVASDGSTSAGIYVTTYFAGGTTATITGNTLTDNTDGIAVGYDGSDASVVVAHNNKLEGNSTGINSTHPTVNAIENWWGDQSGPSSVGTGVGDNVSANVTFSPWCLTSDCSTYSSIYSNSAGVNLGTSQDVTVGDLTLENVIGTGSLFVAKYDGIPSTGGLSTGVDGFYYDIQASGIDFPISITLNYSDTLGASNYLDENHFTSLYYYQGGSWHDYKLDTVGTTGYAPSTVAIDKPNNKITATLRHLTPIVPVIDTTAPPVPTLVSPADGAVKKPASLILNWSDESDPNGPVTYKYKSSWSGGGSYGPVSTGTTSQINASGSSDRVYSWQVQACDSLNNCSDWSAPWTVTVDSVTPVVSFTDNVAIGPVLSDSVTLTVSDLHVDTSTYEYGFSTDNTCNSSDTFGNPFTSGTPFTINTETNNGKYICARASDLAGNTSYISSSQVLNIDVTGPTTPGQIGWSSENPPVGSDYLTGADFANYKTCGQKINYSPMSNLWGPSTDTNGVAGYDREVYSPNSTTLLASSSLSTNYVNGGGAVDGRTYWARIRAFDAFGNKSGWTEKCAITYDITAPVVTEVTPVSTPASDPTPTYTFNSSEAGEINYEGDCSSSTATAILGNNTVTFNSLGDGTHNNCTIKVTDSAGNASNTLDISSFEIDSTVPAVGAISLTTGNGTYKRGNGAGFNITATITDTSGSGIASCFYTLNGGSTWLAATYSGTTCSKIGATAANGTVLSINIKGIDNATNEGLGTVLTRTADSANPVVSGVAVTPTSSSYTDGTPIISATITDSVSPINLCQYRVRTTTGPGVWSVWTAATFVGSTCSKTVTGLTDTISYDFQIRGRDSVSHYGNSSIFTRIIDSTNPVVDAGADKTINSLYTQDATVSDVTSGIASYNWTKQSGPGNITFGTSASEDTTVSADTDGTYQLRLTVTDNVGNSTYDEMTLVWDTQEPTLSTKIGFSDWYNDDQLSTFTYADSFSGIISGTPVTCTINTEGTARTCSVTPNVCDAAGNCNTTPVTSNGANIDKTNPHSTITAPSNSGSGTTIYTSDWTGSILGTASDSISDVNGVKVSIQKGSTQYFNGTTFVDSATEILLTANYGAGNWDYALSSPGEGSYTVRSHAIDNATNMESTYTLTIILDKTIPEVAISLNPAVADAQNGWYKTQPEVTLTATDTNIEKIEYQWNSKTGVWTTYSLPFKPGNEGANVLYYRSKDKANNYSEVGIKNIKWDKTELTDGPLNMSISPNPTSGTTSVVKWEEAKDNIGIDRYEIKWSLKDGNITYMDAVGNNIREHTIDNLTEGVWNVYVTAFDGSGNSKNTSADLTVDQTGPTAPQLSVLGTDVGSVYLSWTKINEANNYIIWYGTTSGSYQYGAKVGDIQNYTVQGLGAGSYYFIVKAVDSSGNQSGNSNEVSTGAIIGVPGVAENTPAEGFAENVLGEATESAKLTPTGTVLGTDTKNAKKKMLWWQWLLISFFAFGGIYFGYKKWKK